MKDATLQAALREISRPDWQEACLARLRRAVAALPSASLASSPPSASPAPPAPGVPRGRPERLDLETRVAQNHFKGRILRHLYITRISPQLSAASTASATAFPLFYIDASGHGVPIPCAAFLAPARLIEEFPLPDLAGVDARSLQPSAAVRIGLADLFVKHYLLRSYALLESQLQALPADHEHAELARMLEIVNLVDTLVERTFPAQVKTNFIHGNLSAGVITPQLMRYFEHKAEQGQAVSRAELAGFASAQIKALMRDAASRTTHDVFCLQLYPLVYNPRSRLVEYDAAAMAQQEQVACRVAEHKRLLEQYHHDVPLGCPAVFIRTGDRFGKTLFESIATLYTTVIAEVLFQGDDARDHVRLQ